MMIKTFTHFKIFVFLFLFIPAFEASAQQILDRLSSQPLAAYSLRKLKTDATIAIQVRRSSDHTLKNIGFDANGNLDVTELATFVGNANGFIQTWYDQSGNSKHVSNATQAGQPKIVSSGNIELQDNLPSILWSSSPLTSLTAQTPLITTDKHTINVVNKLNRVTSLHVMVGNVASNYFGYINAGALATTTNGNNKQQRYVTTQTTAAEIVTSVRSQTVGATWKNGILLAKSASSMTADNADMNGIGGFGAYGLSGNMPEVIIFGIVLPDIDRKLLESNQGSYYKITISTPPLRVACVGNSITYGSGLADRNSESYPARLQSLLGSNYTISNFGFSGATMLKATSTPYYGTSIHTNALGSTPDIVLIKLGTNDSKPANRTDIITNFKNDCKSLIASFEALLPKPKVILITPAPCFTVNDTDRADGINGLIIKNDISPLVKEVATELGLEVIDLNSSLVGNAQLFPDKVHPNAEGANVIAKEVYKALEGQEYVLPVTLSSFTATERNHSVQLNWTTMSEKNNSHFNVLRSSNAIDFNLLAKIKGSGSSEREENYRYTDLNPFTGINYYKLEQYDFDGTVTAYPIIYTKSFSKGLTMSASASVQSIRINLNSPKKGTGTLVVYDINGRILLSKELSFAIGTQDYTLPLTISQGIYVLRFKSGTESISAKVVVN